MATRSVAAASGDYDEGNESEMTGLDNSLKKILETFEKLQGKVFTLEQNLESCETRNRILSDANHKLLQQNHELLDQLALANERPSLSPGPENPAKRLRPSTSFVTRTKRLRPFSE